MSKDELPEWERVLSAAIHAKHRLSEDADHVLDNLRTRFDAILAELESVAGWKTARINRPVQVLGSLDGIETGVRQLIRSEPLEITTYEHLGQKIRIPTRQEMLRIKGALILKRNATRDYLDFIGLWSILGDTSGTAALVRFDAIYPQSHGQSALQQLQIQLANPLPYDLDQTNLSEYKNLNPRWREWEKVKEACTKAAMAIFDGLADDRDIRPQSN